MNVIFSNNFKVVFTEAPLPLSSILLTKVSWLLSFWLVWALRPERKQWVLRIFKVWWFFNFILLWWGWRWRWLQCIIVWLVLWLVACLIMLPHCILISKPFVTFATSHKWLTFLLVFELLLLTESWLVLQCSSSLYLNFFWLVSILDRIFNKCPLCHMILFYLKSWMLLFAKFRLSVRPMGLIKRVGFLLNLVVIHFSIHQINL